jgi:cell division inhibitor SulA
MKRKIKIEQSGDFFRRRTFPQIRLKGKWLEACGVPANQHVHVSQIAPGKLLLEVQP